MPLVGVYSYVQAKLAPNKLSDTEDKLIDTFLISLKDSKSLNSIRMLICIGIDIKVSIKKFGTEDIYRNTLIKGIRDCIIKSCTYTSRLKSIPSTLPPEFLFSIAQKEISPASYHPCICCEVNLKYSRIYNLKSYLMNVVQENRDARYNPDCNESIDPNEIMRYKREFILLNKFRSINITRLGRQDSWVFLADSSEINATNYKRVNKTADILDRLGFYFENIDLNNYYICLVFDNKFSESTFQPDTLTGDWGNFDTVKTVKGNDFFLSSPLIDEWGRTNSVTGTKSPMKERVHKNFDYNYSKLYKMKAYKVGVLERPMNRSSTFIILKEAINRFNLA